MDRKRWQARLFVGLLGAILFAIVNLVIGKISVFQNVVIGISLGVLVDIGILIIFWAIASVIDYAERHVWFFIFLLSLLGGLGAIAAYNYVLNNFS